MDTTTQLQKRLLQNDSTLTDLIVAPFNNGAFYSPESLPGWKRLGTLLGDNNCVTKLTITFPWNRSIPRRTQFNSLISLAYGLKKNRNIKCISFHDVDFKEYNDKTFFMSMGSFFRNNQCLRELQMYDCSLDLECWHLLGRCIERSLIKTIIIDGTVISMRSLTSISSAFHGSLDKLSLTNCGIDDRHINTIIKCWKIDNSVPTTIDLSNNPDIDDCACDYLSCVTVAVSNLSLENTPIGNNGVYSLLSYTRATNNGVGSALRLNGGSALRTLNLDGTDINDVACETLQTLLQHESYSVKKLSLNRNNITSKGLLVLLNGLKNNKHLQVLSLLRNNIHKQEWGHILTLICDESTIDSTYFSNHTLRMIRGPPKKFYNSSVGDKIKQMFHINFRANVTWKKKSSTAKLAGASKVVLSHLTNLNKSTSTFLDGTDDFMFPYALGWLSELNGGCITLSAFYHLCKHNCNLFKLAIRYSSSSNRKRGMCEITQLNGKDYLLDNNTISSKPHKKRIVTSQQLVDVI